MAEYKTLDTTVEELDTEGGVDDYKHIKLDEPATIEIGESAGNAITVEADHFVAASVFDEQEVGEMEAAMSDREAGDIITIDEASVFVSNEDGAIGGGVIQVEEGDIDEALERFEKEHL